MALAALAAAGAAGCAPEIIDTTPLVTGPRVIAAAVAPAEARPGDALALAALDVAPDGAAARALGWGFCTARPPLTTPGALSSDCLGDAAPALVPIGAGAAVGPVAMPADVCGTFGPDQPAPKPGQPPGRPADPDPTGGYYQPVRITEPGGGAGATEAFGARALCHLASATPGEQAELDRRYRRNENPIVAGVALGDGTPVPSLEEDPTSALAVAAGAPITLRVSWPACPAAGADVCGDGVCGVDETADDCPADCAAPRGCGGAETYLWFDPGARAFVERREEIRVAWFATGGSFATARTGRSEADAAAGAPADSDNVWTAPASAGDVWLWVVIRDARGGVAWSSHRLRVP
jgi:hypothetical protein